MSEEHGIPGHVGHSDWSRMLQNWLKDCHLRFEAEGEATRVILDNGVMLEVSESPGGEGYELVLSIPLAGTTDESSEYADAVKDSLRLLSGLKGYPIKYELDTSLQAYPKLLAIIEFEDPWELAESMTTMLSGLCKERV